MVLESGMDVTILLEEVRDWLRKKPGNRSVKARELDVSYFWLQRFMKGQITNITTDRLQMLVERMEAEKRAAKHSRPKSDAARPESAA